MRRDRLAAPPVSGGTAAQGGLLNWVPAGGGWGTGDVSLQTGGAEHAAHGNPNNWFYNPVMGNWGSFTGGGGVGQEVQDYNNWYNNVMGEYTNNPGTLDPNVTSVLADIQSGASNPLFYGSIWSNWHVGDPTPGTQLNGNYQPVPPNPIWMPNAPINPPPNPNPYGPGTPYVSPGVVRTGLEMFGT